MTQKKTNNKKSNSGALNDDLKAIASENTLYRRVFYTGKCSQLVLMSIPPGGEICEEEQWHSDLILFIVKGRGNITRNAKPRRVGRYDVIFVPAGNLHSLKNSGQDDLKILCSYAPPEYLDGAIWRTQQEAEASARQALEHAWEQ
jgi:mannose-6-phosphate isomerase-like protein (cupin superfamily)